MDGRFSWYLTNNEVTVISDQTRFPGKLAPNVERNSESLTAKRSKKDNKVEEILGKLCYIHFLYEPSKSINIIN